MLAEPAATAASALIRSDGAFHILLKIRMTFKSMAMKAPLSLLRTRTLPSLADSLRKEKAG
jgi:hypothetical protein